MERYEYYGDERKIGHNNHKVHIEFVAIPNYFDIKAYLSMREITGQFMSHEITLESVLLIAESVRESPIFTLSSPTGHYASSALFVIEVLKQIGLTVKGFSNFLPTNIKSYESILKNTKFTNSNGKPVIDMTIIFINLYKLVEEGVLKPVIESLEKAEDYSHELELTSKIYKS